MIHRPFAQHNLPKAQSHGHGLRDSPTVYSPFSLNRTEHSSRTCFNASIELSRMLIKYWKMTSMYDTCGIALQQLSTAATTLIIVAALNVSPADHSDILRQLNMLTAILKEKYPMHQPAKRLGRIMDCAMSELRARLTSISTETCSSSTQQGNVLLSLFGTVPTHKQDMPLPNGFQIDSADNPQRHDNNSQADLFRDLDSTFGHFNSASDEALTSESMQDHEQGANLLLRDDAHAPGMLSDHSLLTPKSIGMDMFGSTDITNIADIGDKDNDSRNGAEMRHEVKHMEENLNCLVSLESSDSRHVSWYS